MPVKHGRCIAYPKFKVLYMPVPKAGCAALQAAFLKMYGIEPVDGEINKTSIELFMLSTVLNNEEATLDEIYSEYFKFTVVRNPYERVLSAYLNKFVTANCQYPPARRIAREIGHPPSFREFIMYLVRRPAEQFDEHWRPQSSIVHGFPLDHIGHLEDLDKTLAALTDVIGQPVVLDDWNRTAYDGPLTGAMDMPCDRLATIPNAESFYDAELRRHVKELYRNDFIIFYPRIDA